MPTAIGDFKSLPFWTGSEQELLHHLEKNRGQIFFIVTLTAEMILCGMKNKSVAQAIFSADIVVVDSISVMWWLTFLCGKPVHRITGVHLSKKLLELARIHHYRVAVLGGKTDVICQRAANHILKNGIDVTYAAHGPTFLNFAWTESETYFLNETALSKPNIVFAGFGHGKQEMWLRELKNRLIDPAILVGVGGTIDLWGGAQKRAPVILQQFGFEWLWRLILQPTRFIRILQATVVFPYRAITDFLVYSHNEK